MEQLGTVLPVCFPTTAPQREFDAALNAQLHHFNAIIDHRLDAGNTDDHTKVNRDFDRIDIDDSRGFALKGFLGAVDPNETAEEREERKVREGYYEQLERAEVEAEEEEEAEKMGDGRVYVVDGEFDEHGNQVIMRGGLVWEGGRLIMKEVWRGVRPAWIRPA